MQILSQYCLKDLLVDYVNESFTVEGYNEQWVAQASNRIAMLLKEPVFTVQVDPEFMVAMSVLRNSKKHFSMQVWCCTATWHQLCAIFFGVRPPSST